MAKIHSRFAVVPNHPMTQEESAQCMSKGINLINLRKHGSQCCVHVVLVLVFVLVGLCWLVCVGWFVLVVGWFVLVVGVVGWFVLVVGWLLVGLCWLLVLVVGWFVLVLVLSSSMQAEVW